MIDWHCHLLPGVDDGANNLEESLAMGRVLVAAGFTEVYCTPHCLHGAYDNTPHGVQKATAALQQAFHRQHISLKLHPGMEYYLDEMFLRKTDDLQPLGSSRLVLVEAPQQAHPDFLKDALFQLLRRKWIPVVAHPERCMLFDQTRTAPESSMANWLARLWPFRRAAAVDVLPPSTSLLQTLVDMGCQFQGNISSFAGFYGPEVANQAHAHLAAGLYGYFGSDGHDARSLKRYLSRGLGMVTDAQILSAECKTL